MIGSLLDDLHAEQQVLDDLLASLPATAWRSPVPADGWTIADTVRHLVVAERAATDSVRDDCDFVGPTGGSSVEESEVFPAELDHGSLLEGWRSARAATLDAMRRRSPADRVPWGGRRMTIRSLATARLMETWAHGLDCFVATHHAPVDTDRLVHVAWLGHRTLPYAFAVHGVDAPAPPHSLRLALVAPSGASWTFGPAASNDTIAGPAATWCRLVTHRLRGEPAELDAHGPLARASLDVAQCYLEA